MVAVNDQILLRRPFSFKKGESRSVSASFTVPSGAAAVKVWLSGPDMPSAFATTTAQIAGGETRTLRARLLGRQARPSSSSRRGSVQRAAAFAQIARNRV